MVIKEFNINLNHISNNGDTRNFSIKGDPNAIFSLMIKKQTGSTITYYDFSTNTFGSTQKKLKNRKLNNGVYRDSIVFPAGSLSYGDNPNTYTLMLFAESAYGTRHIDHVEKRFPDSELDLNSSIGSNSNLMEKVIYQFPETRVSYFATQQGGSLSGGFTGMSATTDIFNIQRGLGSGKLSLKTIATLASTKAGAITRQPQISDFFAYTARTLLEPVEIPGVTTPQDSEDRSATITSFPSNANQFTINSAAEWAVGMTVKGIAIDGIHDIDSPVIITGISTNDITINKSITITSSVANAAVEAYDIRYRRWKCDEIQGLTPGMIAFSGGVSAGTTISQYIDVTNQTIETVDKDGGINEETVVYTNFNIPALDPSGNTPDWQYGKLNTQKGIITFDTPQVVASNRNVATKFHAYGKNGIEKLTNCSFNVTDLTVTVADVTTTVNDTDADGNTPLSVFTVTSASGILDDVSVVSGVNISGEYGDPVVTNISTNDITVSPSNQYLQNGQTLTFSGAGRVFTISADIEFEKVDGAGFDLAIDVDKFITAS